MADRIGTFMIREAGGLRFANSLILGSGLRIDTSEGEIPELIGTGSGTTFTGVKAWPSAPVPLPSLTETSIPFGMVGPDTDGFWNAAQPTRLTVPDGLGGVYLVVAHGVFAATADFLLATGFRLNGTTILGLSRMASDASGGSNLTATEIVTLRAGDYLELRLYHTSGVTVNAYGGDSYETSLMMTRLGA
ncbi:MAG TPA: hypothetical protein VE913_23950 [Longimicrobium sp.]|nr:hypothetical protein [Longimicrobium sp.]